MNKNNGVIEGFSGYHVFKYQMIRAYGFLRVCKLSLPYQIHRISTDITNRIFYVSRKMMKQER